MELSSFTKAAHIPRLVLALHVEAGGLMSYGTDVLDMYRQVGERISASMWPS